MNKKDFYTQNLKKQIEERSRPIDTTKVQLNSVKLFMEQLGYSLHHPQKDYPSLWKGFIKQVEVEGVKLSKCISFQNACRLHNGVTMRVVGGEWCDLITMTGSFPMHVYLAALNSRLVKKVYLQRKGKSVKCQQHWVKFVD